MAIIKQIGTDDVGNDFPWFWKTDITCPRCTSIFRLTHEETLPGVVGPIGTLNTLWLGWRQVVESATPLTAAIDTANLHVDPAQVYGACPYCGYNPIIVLGPRYGLVKVTLNADPVVGLLQSYVAGGATQVTFFQLPDLSLVGIFLLATGAFYHLDSTGLYATAIRRLGVNLLDAASAYLVATPAAKVTPGAAVAADAPLIAILQRAGLTII